MASSTQQTGFAEDASFSRLGQRGTDPLDLEKEILCAGYELKRVVCSRLLGEISDEQYALLRTRLLDHYRALTEASRDAGRSERAAAGWH
jgi:hypothetical protein